MPGSIVVVGDVCLDLDLHYGTIRQSPEGLFPVVALKSETHRPGMGGAVAIMAASLAVNQEAEVFLAGAIGTNERETHNLWMDLYKPVWINRRAFIQYSDRTTTVKKRVFIDDQQQYREDLECVQSITNSQADEAIEDLPDDAGIVLVADYGKGMITEYLFERLLEKYVGLDIIVDPAIGRDFEFYSGATCIVPNRQEMRHWLHSMESFETNEERLDAIREELGLKALVLKLDQDGMVCCTKDDCQSNGTTQKNIVDVCGAGDQVLAALGVARNMGYSWQVSAAWANYCAGLKCKKQGATPVTAAEAIDGYCDFALVKPREIR